MNDNGSTVSELGEDGLVDLIAKRIGSAPPGEIWTGDDAAVIAARAGSLLVTTDALVEGVDFDLSYCSCSDVGWKAVAVNASDIAAMGGSPTHAVMTVALPPRTPVARFEDLLDGCLEAGRRWDISLVGGDISRAESLSVAVAMIGSPVEGGPVTRAGARAGDALCVTGSLGGAAAGLRLLNGRAALDEEGAAAVRRQLRPEARVAEAEALCAVGITAMIDLSDGLAVDAARLMRASGVGCEIERVPIDPNLAAMALSDDDRLRLSVLGGEDFELLFCIEPELIPDAVAALQGVGTACTRIGTVGGEERTLMGEPLERWKESGWDHLRNR